MLWHNQKHKYKKWTAKQRDSGRREGVAASQKSCAYRNFLKRYGSVSHVQTCFFCSVCKIPLWRKNKVEPEAGRTTTCLEKHAHSDKSHLSCNDFTHCENFPKKLLIFTLREVASNTEKDVEHACVNCLLLFVNTVNFKSIIIILKFKQTFSLTT